MDQTLECTPFLISDGEIRVSYEREGTFVHVAGAPPDDDKRVIAALKTVCAVTLPIKGRYSVGWHALQEAMRVPGRQVIARRFE